MKTQPLRRYILHSIQMQMGIWLAENSQFPDIQIYISTYLRAVLRAECNDTCVVHDDSVQETFCGYPLVLDKNLPDNKFEIRFLTCNQVRMRVTLTG